MEKASQPASRLTASLERMYAPAPTPIPITLLILRHTHKEKFQTHTPHTHTHTHTHTVYFKSIKKLRVEVYMSQKNMFLKRVCNSPTRKTMSLSQWAGKVSDLTLLSCVCVCVCV